MRDRYDDIQAKGAGVAAIGMGRPDMAADFRDRFDIPFPLIIDHTKETYRALELKRGGVMEVLGPRVWLRGAKSILSGNLQARASQDPMQLGGAVVVEPGGEILFIHRSEDASDNVPVDALIAALP